MEAPLSIEHPLRTPPPDKPWARPTRTRVRTVHSAILRLAGVLHGHNLLRAPHKHLQRLSKIWSADDEPDTRPTIGEEGSALWLTTTKSVQAAHSSRKPAAHQPHRRLPFLTCSLLRHLPIHLSILLPGLAQRTSQRILRPHPSHRAPSEPLRADWLRHLPASFRS